MPCYETVPNQKIINIKEEGKEICDKDHKYFFLQKQTMFNAMNTLTPAIFQVWLYLSSHASKYKFAFSPKAVSKETSIKKSTLQEGIRVLISKRYLIQRENSNIYDFYQEPQPAEDEEKKEDKIYIQTHNNEGFIF